MRLLFALSLVLLATPAFATGLQIDRDACKLVTHHRQLPDVNYQGGVDIHGRDVVPADLNAQPTIGDTFTIPVTIDIGEQFGIPLMANGGMAAGTRATVAMITVDGAEVYLDGQPLTPEQEENLAVLCLERTDD